MYSGYCDLLHKASLEREVYCIGIISFNEKRFTWPLIFNTKRLKQKSLGQFFFLNEQSLEKIHGMTVISTALSIEIKTKKTWRH